MDNPSFIPLFTTIPIEHIAEQMMDESITYQEKIKKLKNMVQYLTKCRKTMMRMFSIFDNDCQVVINCMKDLLEDLEREHAVQNLT